MYIMYRSAKSDENRIRFRSCRTAPGQLAQENQKLVNRDYIRIDEF